MSSVAIPSLATVAEPRRASFSLQLKSAARLYLLLAPTFVLLAIFNVVPFFWAFASSLYEFEIGENAKFVGLRNYAEYFHDYTFAQSFANMLMLTIFALL